MDNNSDKKRIFNCSICGDIIKQEYILLMIRCDECLYKPTRRSDKYNHIKIVSDDKKIERNMVK
jgi:DNA-directed RNA polymerase subunit RPC12/RpoP